MKQFAVKYSINGAKHSGHFEAENADILRERLNAWSPSWYILEISEK